MPLDPSDFPEEVQVAFFIFSLFSDKWEGMSGTYLGKDWTNLEYYLELYEVSDKKSVIYFMHLYDNLIVEARMNEASAKRKQEERKSKTSSGGGKKFAHKIQG